jgi:hypothetical protein
MECVSPPCTGSVLDGQCPVCNLMQRQTSAGVVVDGPLYVTRRSKDGTDQSMKGRSVTVGGRVVTVWLGINDKATRTVDLSALVSIDAA